MKEKTILAQNIQTLRKEKGWTQEQMSKETGISMPAIRSYENSLREPEGKALVAMEQAFGVTGRSCTGWSRCLIQRTQSRRSSCMKPNFPIGWPRPAISSAWMAAARAAISPVLLSAARSVASLSTKAPLPPEPKPQWRSRRAARAVA